METYESLGVIGEGTYGVVMKARHRETGQVVAIKKFKESDEDEQVRKTSLREVRVLKQLRHDNIITLLEVFRRKGKLYLVFEYVERTILEVLEQRPHGLEDSEVRRYMYQLLRGVEYCHAHNVMHRDIKPENILISKNGTLKLCDFGFARAMSIGGKYTDYVATRWYRCPELLVGDVEYGKGVDVWAIGCIFAEIATGMPLFPGESDVDQLAHIMRCFGKLTTRQVQTFRRNPLYVGVDLPSPTEQQTLDMRFPTAPRPWINFLKACLKNDPDQRESCTALMNLPYFTENNFRGEMEQELKLLFEKESKQLVGIGSRSSNKENKQAERQQRSTEMPPAQPARTESPAVAPPPTIVPNNKSQPAQGPHNGQAAPTVPSIGTLWSQYLASTSTELPDLGTKVQNLQTTHPLFAQPGAAGRQQPVTSHSYSGTSGNDGGGLYYRHDNHAQHSTPDPLGPRRDAGAARAPPAPSNAHAPSYTPSYQQPQPSKPKPASHMFPTLHNAQQPTPPMTSGSMPSSSGLGLSYKKPKASTKKGSVLSTLSLTAYGQQPQPAPASYSTNPYAIEGNGMVLHGHQAGQGTQPRGGGKHW